MQKIILYTIFIVVSFLSKVVAQEKTFEKQVKEIASNIELITNKEKNNLKVEVEAIDLQVKEGKITLEKGKELKQKVAEECAKNIENKISLKWECIIVLN